jgi:hypothetical protein
MKSANNSAKSIPIDTLALAKALQPLAAEEVETPPKIAKLDVVGFAEAEISEWRIVLFGGSSAFSPVGLLNPAIECFRGQTKPRHITQGASAHPW